MGSLSERDYSVQQHKGEAGVFWRLAVRTVIPLYYHWLTSGYGAFSGEQPVGWLFLRGWHQMLYIETLAVHPNWRNKGIGTALMDFAEQQARELHRSWLGLRVTLSNQPAVQLYESLGYQRGPWRVMQKEGISSGWPGAGHAIQLRSLAGLAAFQAYARFAHLDLTAGDAWGAEALDNFLEVDFHWGPGQHWLVIFEGRPIAYLSRHKKGQETELRLACDADWWGSSQEVEAIGLALRTPDRPLRVTIRASSNGHHETMRPTLESLGFVEQPMATTRMVKRLEGN
jgi:GNAT superfamily N-acetyltransferase